MGTITEKLTYLNSTKQLLKENINNLGGNLTNEPFRQYASVLEGIYESLPKVSGIGASLSLSPSMVGKIKLNEIQGDTLQDGTPTPSSPVPIQSVTGLQNVGVCGKNLIDISTLEDGYVASNGTISTLHENQEMYSNFIKVNPSTTYTFKIYESAWSGFNTNNWFGVGEYSTNNTSSWLVRDTMITGTQNYITFTTNANTNYIIVSARGLASATKVQLELGTANEYEPYKGNTYEVNLGKNLFDKSVSPSSQNGTSTTELDTGIRATITSAGQNKYTAINLPNPSNLLGKTLTISSTITISGTNNALIRFYWLNGNTLSSLIANSISTTGSASITIPSSFPSGTNGIAMVLSSNASGTSQIGDYVDYTNVQLEVGSTATTYAPYFTPIELNKIGTYEDSIKKSTGKNLVYEIEQGSFNYQTGAFNTNANIIRTKKIPVKPNTTYTISSKLALGECCTYFYENDGTTGIAGSLLASTTTVKNISFTTPNNAYYMIFRLGASSVPYTYTDDNNIMLNEGSTALPYEPYGKVWYKTYNTGEKTFNGSETWETQWNGDNIHGWRTTIPNLKQTTSGSQSSYVISNNYETRTQDENFSTGNYGISNRANQSQIIIKNNDITSQNDFITWLSTHNTTVLYQLATPIYEVITNTELINQLESLNNAKSEDGTTNINVTSEDLSMILNVGVLKGDAE